MFMTFFQYSPSNSSCYQNVILVHIWLFHLNDSHWSFPNTRYGNKLASAAAIHSLADVVLSSGQFLLISNDFVYQQNFLFFQNKGRDKWNDDTNARFIFLAKRLSVLFRIKNVSDQVFKTLNWFHKIIS